MLFPISLDRLYLPNLVAHSYLYVLMDNGQVECCANDALYVSALKDLSVDVSRIALIMLMRFQMSDDAAFLLCRKLNCKFLANNVLSFFLDWPTARMGQSICFCQKKIFLLQFNAF